MKKILVVEDNEMNRKMLIRRLRHRGFEIIVAINGEDAIKESREEKPDLILMDIGLPVMDGWEATEKIKADPATRHIPIIALTAHAMESDRFRSLASGCDEFETKPIDFDRLIKKIGDLLDGDA